MNINQKAIAYLERNQYDLALKTFQQAVNTSRDVQSLNNLAYYFANEEDLFDVAIILLKEAVAMAPIHHFPYASLAQIYVQTDQYEQAIDICKASLSIKDTTETRYNLGVCFYQIGKFDEAVKALFPISRKDESAKFLLIRSHYHAGRKTEAKQLLDAYAKTHHVMHDRLFAELSIAELYLELRCLEEAVVWYKKALEIYYPYTKWIRGYVYALTAIGQNSEAQKVLQQVLAYKISEISETENDTDFDEHYTKEDNDEALYALKEEKEAVENITETLQDGFVPQPKFDPSCQVNCYLFGCTRHGHPEYSEVSH